MTARADYPKLAEWASINDRSLSWEQLNSALEEIDRLRDLLANYGRHNEGCNAEQGDQYRCRCGWRDVQPTDTEEA